MIEETEFTLKSGIKLYKGRYWNHSKVLGCYYTFYASITRVTVMIRILFNPYKINVIKIYRHKEKWRIKIISLK